MELSEKIMTLRRRNGWSQEELAERLDVSRQSVSKWEMGQSTPELDKIVQMSDLFGVSSDALIRDELDLQGAATQTPPKDERESGSEKGDPSETETGNSLSESDARTLIANARRKSIFTAIGAALCILSPALLIMEQIVAGMIVLFSLIAIAVACFVTADHLWKNTPYSVYTKGDRLSAEAAAYIRENAPAANRRSLVLTIIGVILFILSPIYLVTVSISPSGTRTDFMVETGVAVLLGVVAVGVFLVILRSTESTIWERFHAILENRIPNDIRSGEEPQDARERESERDRGNNPDHPFGRVFWCAVTALYLALSFITGRWGMTWIIWPIAGILFAAIEAILIYVRREKN